MNVIEAWGSGIPKMFREAEAYGLREPELVDMGSDFRVNLYRKSAQTDQNGVIDPKNPEQFGNSEQSDIVGLSNQEMNIIKFIRKYKVCTTIQVAEILEVTDRRARSILGKLVDKEILRKSGKARNTIYIAGSKFPK